MSTNENRVVHSHRDALERLKEGNQRYVSNTLHSHDFPEQRRELLGGQKPFAVILTCSDSRVPPEYIFNQSLGQLFVVRVAGNVVTPEILASIEYAVLQLGCRLLVVMGHGSCGAVKAALEGEAHSAHIKELFSRLEPALYIARQKEKNEKKLLETAIRENVRFQIKEALDRSEILKASFEKGELSIFAAHYHLHTGQVEFEKHS